jgi:hypothetical protein
VKYFAIWSYMSQMNGHALALREAYDNGIDPATVELNSQTAAKGKKAKGTNGHRLECFHSVRCISCPLHISWCTIDLC